jgi:8-oxo-dGTP diphosphatase
VVPYTSDYPIFSVTADVVLFAGQGVSRSVLLIRRGRDPYVGQLALPGGFVDIDEDLPTAALRELAEETGVTGVTLRQLGTYGRPGRDPRGRTVSVVYVGQVPEELPATAGDDAAEAAWFSVSEVIASPQILAFDHDEVVKDAVALLATES